MTGDLGQEDDDAYSLFHKRSEGMGWLDTRGVLADADGGERTVGSPGLWGMNDAGGERGDPASPGPHPDAWFQVGLTAVEPRGSLPLQPFLRCADDVWRRLGGGDLWGAQLVVPVEMLHAEAETPLWSATSTSAFAWFAGEPTTAATPRPTVIEISSGDPLPAGTVEGLVDDLAQLAGTVLDVDPGSIEHGTARIPVTVADHFWQGPAADTVRISGTARVWSAESIGALTSLLADSCSRRGVLRTIVVSVSDSSRPAPRRPQRHRATAPAPT